MKKTLDRRLIRYNHIAANPPDEEHTWYFFIVNECRFAKKLRERIFNQLKPLEEVMELKFEEIGDGLSVLCFSCNSSKSDINRKVYDGTWVFDDQLYKRPRFEEYLDLLTKRA